MKFEKPYLSASNSVLELVVKLRDKAWSLFATGPCSGHRAQLHSDANTQQ